MKALLSFCLAVTFLLTAGCGNPRIHDPLFSARLPDGWQRDDIPNHAARFVPKGTGSAGYILVSAMGRTAADSTPKALAEQHFAAWRSVSDGLQVEYYAERDTSIRYEASYRRSGQEYVGYGLFEVTPKNALAVIAAIESDQWQKHRFGVQRFVESFRARQ